MHIRNKVALITGATGGIGLQSARALLDREILAVGMVDISAQCPEMAEQLIQETGNPNIPAFTGDVSDPEFRKEVFSHMEQEFGPVQICIPAAGILRDGLAVRPDRKSSGVELYSETSFKEVIAVNLMHPTYWSMETIAGMARHRIRSGKAKWGAGEAIQAVNILIGSVSSRGNRGQVSYSAAKSALRGVCSTLNLEGLHHGVLTKIIHPGFVDTPMVDTIDPDYFRNNLAPDIGLDRKIQPEEIARCICSMVEHDVISGDIWADASLRPMA